ncbi:hypothetical protein GCM10022270_09190 [Terriglobus aquaticus]
MQPYLRRLLNRAANRGHGTARATRTAAPACRQRSDVRAAVPAIHAGLDPGADPKATAPFAYFQVPSQKLHKLLQDLFGLSLSVPGCRHPKVGDRLRGEGSLLAFAGCPGTYPVTAWAAPVGLVRRLPPCPDLSRHPGLR